MTGNKNAWRAPLAGLASVAMIATMGVAASTANAAEYTVDENDQFFSVAVYRADQPYKAIANKYGTTTNGNFEYGQTFDLDNWAKNELNSVPYADDLNDGKVLSGFSYDLAGKNMVPGDAFAVKGDTKVYAQYTDAVKVTFKLASGDKSFEIAKGSVLTADEYAAVGDPTAPAGQVFAGWKMGAAADATPYVGQALNENADLYPVFEDYASADDQENVSEVLFDIPNDTSSTVLYTFNGQAFPEFRAPAGTWLQGEKSYDFATKIANDKAFGTPDLTLTKAAEKVAGSYKVVYDFKGADATNNSTDPGSVSEKYYAADETPAKPADPAQKKAVFNGWRDEANNVYNFDKPVSQLEDKEGDNIIVLHATWTKVNVVPVVFYYNYHDAGWVLPTATEAFGKVRPKTGKVLDYVVKNSKLVPPTGLEDYFQTDEDAAHGTYTSSTVSGWYSLVDDAPVTTFNASAAVYAKWTGASSVTLNGNGGLFKNGLAYAYVSKSDSQKWQDVAEVPTREGYTFTYWVGANGAKKGLRANLYNGTYEDNDPSHEDPAIKNGDELVAQWQENNAASYWALIRQYGLNFYSKPSDVAKLVKDGYTKASATKFVDEMYKLYDEAVALDKLEGQDKIDATAKLVKEINAAEKLLVRQDAAEVPSGTQPVYRLYNPNETRGGAHVYTTDLKEYDYLKQQGWVAEGVQFYTTTSKDATPVYRVYNRNDGSHHYTVDQKEAKYLVAAGWTDEGVGFYVSDDASDEVFRIYNKYTGEHVFTTAKAEVENAVAAGWTDEGVAFKAIAK